ncbi:MAG: methyltransferase [Spirochaetaceae bacterium]|nr:methyltransferase [Spirochaetaceae bacterium]
MTGETPRKRLDNTIHHKDPGKLVVDMGSTSITGINANALAALRDALGLEKRPVKIYEPLQLLGLVEEDVYEALGLCVAEVTNHYTIFGYENKNWKPWKLPTGLDVLVAEDFVTSVDEKDGTTYIYPQGDRSAPPAGRLPRNGYYFDNCFRTFSTFDEDNFDGRADFAEDYKVYTDEQLRTIEDTCNHLYTNTDLGLIGGGALAGLGDFAYFPGPHIPYPKGVRNLEDWMVMPYTCPDYIHQIFGLQTEVGLENAKLFKQACGDKIQVMQISGTDFGTQRGPIMSNDTFRTFYQPYYKKINDWIHQNTNWKTFYHCCGSIVELLPDFYETGIDILNPVQCSAACMDPRMLKEKWGDKFTFWGGGVNTQKTLPFGTPEEVYNEVTERLSIFAPGGGFVFNTIHNIQGQTPVQNILAIFRAIDDYNKKPGFNREAPLAEREQRHD